MSKFENLLDQLDVETLQTIYLLGFLPEYVTYLSPTLFTAWEVKAISVTLLLNHLPTFLLTPLFPSPLVCLKVEGFFLNKVLQLEEPKFVWWMLCHLLIQEIILFYF